ncbi:unnamed protein product (macronuclear) [Paramecium tetraurelia]|uniref:Autophagy-related protein n=1 Tax=Paramecium tetraurelia TaxID=5888 RepID=A0BFQ7_PARTE|nr:uncharacterized protein GSPATT00028409001 [Paramecium tetraurelia]CAK57374.1 unnamed protein product [Paramecium tetraurelia]|eukprot:XP_001424772.1 hypothetical protein (macronuclear) [Paramecium tetraurelia strain d4-2]
MCDNLKISDNFIEKYPDRVPILLQISVRSRLQFQDGTKIKKYLMSKSDHFYHFLQIIRETLHIQQQESLYLFINNSGLVKAESQVDEVYNKFKSPDGFLRIQLTEYPSFGQ